MSCGFPIELTGGVIRPCGKCQGCLRRRRRAWVGRMLVEAAACGGDSSFVTLTYDDDHVPLVYHSETGTWIPTLDKSHALSWLRSVRRKATAAGLPRRWFMAGEYGTKLGRPHLHVILFGIGPTWQSHFEDSWQRGFQSWYPASVRAMAYVAKYCLKHGRDPELELPTSQPQCDGETARVSVPPFRRLSRNPPIGGDLARKVADAVCKKGSPQALLDSQRALEGTVRISGDKYPLDRTIRQKIDAALRDVYAVEDETRNRLMARVPFEPTATQIENARQAHIRASQRARSRHKL